MNLHKISQELENISANMLKNSSVSTPEEAKRNVLKAIDDTSNVLHKRVVYLIDQLLTLKMVISDSSGQDMIQGFTHKTTQALIDINAVLINMSQQIKRL